MTSYTKDVARPGWLNELTAEHQALLAVATAPDLDAAMAAVAGIVRQICGAARVEWHDAGGRTPRVVAGGDRPGTSQRRLSLGPAGTLVVIDGCSDAGPESVLAAVSPVLRRRLAEDRLTHTAVTLARRNAALEEFAALVAHELKGPLQAALVADDASSWVEHALGLVDALLDAARDGYGVQLASPAACLREVVRDLGAVDLEITADLPPALPLPPTALRVILRNLLRNAVAARAHAVRVSATRSSATWLLVVEDNGAGLGSARYDAGTGLGLRLCRRIARRYGGSLALEPVPAGGTQARLLLREAA